MPFNLVVGNIKTQNIRLCSLDFKTKDVIIFQPDKFHGISNSAIKEEQYPKVVNNLEKLNEESNSVQNLDDMLKVFKNLMNDDFNYGIEDLEEESSVRVRPYYCKHREQQMRGTQSQIILLVDFEDNYLLEEVYYEPEFVLRRYHFGNEERDKKLRKLRKAVLYYMGILRMRKNNMIKMKTFKSSYCGFIG